MLAVPSPPDMPALRAAVDVRSAQPTAVLPFGVAAIDNRLAGHGLSLGGLHEATGRSASLADDTAAALFLAGVAARCSDDARPVLWALTRRDLYAPGLEQAGLPPARVLYAQGRSDADILALMEDALRHGGIAAVIGETRRVGMTETRRLQLAAADAGAPALLLRRRRKLDVCPLAEPSAAATRWRIGCAPSLPLGVLGVGRHRWAVELARQRGGEPFACVVEACDDQGRLSVAAAAPDRAAAPLGEAARAA